MGAPRSLAVVAEDQDFYSAGLATMLQRQIGFASVQRSKNITQLRQILSTNVPVDMLVIDLALPGSRGIGTVRELRDRFPAMRLAVFARYVDRGAVLSTLAAGAHGFIPKSTEPAELLQALRTIHDNGVFVPPRLADEYGDRGKAEAIVSLTERQRQVTELILEGHPNKVIARELGISPSTVKVHVHAAFRALGVHSRVGAVVALQRAESRYG